MSIGRFKFQTAAPLMAACGCFKFQVLRAWTTSARTGSLADRQLDQRHQSKRNVDYLKLETPAHAVGGQRSET